VEKFEKDFKDLTEGIDAKFSDLEGKMIKGEDVEKLQSDLSDINEKMGEANDARTKMVEDQVKITEQANILETKLKEYTDRAKESKVTDIKSFFKKELEDSKEFQDFKENGGYKTLKVDEKKMFEMVHKAIILQSTHWTGDVGGVDRISNNNWALPHEPARIRDLINFGTTTSATIDFVRTTSTRSAAVVAEGAEKAESEENPAAVQATVQVLAHVFRISKQALEDYGQMATYLSSEGVAGLKDLEDTQLLNGSGGGANLNGVITQASTTYTGGLDIATDTDLDTLLKAVYQLKQIFYVPSAILIPFAKMRAIKLLKDTSGQYIFPNFLPLGLANPVSIDGVPVIEHGAMPADTFLVGDFSRASGFDREAVNVRFSEENEDNFVKNLVSVRIEERIALAVYRPDAFCTATFAAAQSTLT